MRVKFKIGVVDLLVYGNSEFSRNCDTLRSRGKTNNMEVPPILCFIKFEIWGNLTSNFHRKDWEKPSYIVDLLVY